MQEYSIGETRPLVVIDPEVRGGEPVVRGTRIAVHVLADLFAQGASREELLDDHPSLNPESLDAALAYAQTHPRPASTRRPPWSNGVVVGAAPPGRMR